MMRKELDRIGFRFPLGAGSLDTLYPHLIGHHVGIGEYTVCIRDFPLNTDLDARFARVELH